MMGYLSNSDPMPINGFFVKVLPRSNAGAHARNLDTATTDID